MSATYISVMAKLLLPVFVLCVVIGAGYILWKMPAGKQSASGDAVASERVTHNGNAMIGGAFNLIDVEGKPVTQERLLGQHSLVFFGFTHCPDVCPTALQTISQVLDDSGSLGESVLPVFITVDPERDTPMLMKEYMANFHPRILGLTGTKEQTDAAAKAYKVYHQKDGSDRDDYMIGHSGFMYLMSPKGDYITHFTHEDNAEDILVAFAKYVRK